MQRRDLITLLGGAAAAWPLAARAQQRAAMPTVGFLQLTSDRRLIAPFLKGLAEMGFVEGRNVAIEYRIADDQFDRLPALAADLVRRRVAAIAITNSGTTALAAKAATSTIPIIFNSALDPVQLGLVASLNRPGGNATGISNMGGELMPKRLGLLNELLPRAQRFGLLANLNLQSSATPSSSIIADMQAAGSTLGKPVDVLPASDNRGIDAAFASVAEKRIDALLVVVSNLFASRRAQIVSLAAHYRVPTMHMTRDEVVMGGLMSYATSGSEQARLVGLYTGRVLKGEKPSDLPVMQASKFEFVINLHTARLLGIEVPPGLLAIADEVVE